MIEGTSGDGHAQLAWRMQRLAMAMSRTLQPGFAGGPALAAEDVDGMWMGWVVCGVVWCCGGSGKGRFLVAP